MTEAVELEERRFAKAKKRGKNLVPQSRFELVLPT